MNHFLALALKNIYSWKRRFLSSLLEIFVPVSLVSILVLIRLSLSSITSDYSADIFKIAPNTYLPQNSPSFSLCSYYQSKGGEWGYGLVTNNSLTSYLFNQFQENPSTSKLKALFFSSRTDIDSYIQSKDYEKNTKLCFAVEIENYSEDIVEISFRTNSSYVLSEKSSLVGAYIDVYNFFRTETLTEALEESDPDFLYQFLSSGFLQTINYIGNFLLEKESSEKVLITNAKAMSGTKFKRDSVLLIVKSIMPLILYMVYLLPMCRMISAVVKEREEKMKELLIVMGVSNNCYWNSWIFHYISIYSIITALNALVVVKGLFPKSSFIWVFLANWLYGVFCVFYGQLVSIFFRKAKIAIFLSVILFLLSYLVGYGLDSESSTIKTLLCLCPFISFHLAIETICDLEITYSGVTYSSLTFPVRDFQLINAYIAFPIAITILIFLAAYFENVMPSGYKEKKWNFCCKKDYCIKRRLKCKPVIDDQDAVGEFIEDVDAVLQVQKKTRQAMVVRGLSKHYGERKVLKDMNIDIYEGQIFALLGHNSSGKTTTISCLLGSIQPSAGEMTIGDYQLSENLEEIRQMIGACLQENILFSILTPYEHIKIFAIFKRVPLRKITTHFIHEKLAEVKLLEAKDTPAEKLSGGQKRKLCLAIALLGDSKIVVLDEPTSGMDLNSRRYVWDLLKNNKAQRIIILTTHYMEEADILADRVAMLINGRIKCCGSPLYLKANFGGGYYLSLFKTHNVASRHHTESIMAFMETNIHNYLTIVHDLQSEITLQLPFEFSKDCLGFFRKLESSMDELALKGYAISVTTLEEVFMKVMEARQSNKSESSHRASFDETFLGSELSPLKIAERSISKWNQLLAVIRKRAISSKRDVKSAMIEMLCPGLLILFTFAMVNWKFLQTSTEKLSLDSTLYPEGIIAYNSYQQSDQFMSNFDLKMFSVPGSDFESDLNTSLHENLYAGVYFEDLDSSSKFINFTLYPNQMILQSAALYYSYLTQATLTGQNSKIKLKFNNYPFPVTYIQSLVFSLTSSVIVTTGLGIGFAFVPSSIVMFISNEKTTGIKHLQRISGLSIAIYWIANFIWDMIKQCVMVGVSIGLMNGLNFENVKGNSEFQMTYYLIIAFGFNSTLFAYLLSFFFKTPNAANVNSLVIHLISGCLIPIMFLIILSYEISREVVQYIIWILRLLPNFSLNWGIMKIGNSTYITTITGNSIVPNDISWDGCVPELVMLCLECFFLIIGIAMAEAFEQRPYICSKNPKRSSVIPIHDGFDEDVENEAQVANKTDPSDVVVNIKSLSKIFTTKHDPKIAVDDISFNVYRGECFTILGVNGAGKTTTFRILTGTEAPTAGEVYVHGFNVKTEINKVRQSLGYCPQHDVLNDSLTARETLEIYADFRGIPKEMSGRAIEKVLELVGLTEHSEFVCGNYSGGNKRKLCLGIAILGFPELVILDEPTAGMDPESRKKVWKVVNDLKSNQCSVILTSHSMDEAENVSDRITIMTAGRFRCLGAPSYIKQKFGDDFELQLKLENPSKFEIYDLALTVRKVDKDVLLNKETVSEVLKELDCVKYYSLINQRRSGSAVYWTLEKNGGIFLEDLLTWLVIERNGDAVVQFLRDNYSEIKVEEHYLTYFKIKIINEENISLGGIFHMIEINKKLLKIAGYSLSQTTLDQIFNRFSTVTNASTYMPSSPTFQSKVFSFGATRLSEKA